MLWCSSCNGTDAAAPSHSMSSSLYCSLQHLELSGLCLCVSAFIVYTAASAKQCTFSRGAKERKRACAQALPGQWHSSAQLRRKLRNGIDSGLFEFVLKAAGNHQVEGCSLFRCCIGPASWAQILYLPGKEHCSCQGTARLVLR